MKRYNTIVASTIGSYHIRLNKPCQDRVLSFSDWSHKGIVVCDGHGAEKHFRSELGAEFASLICKDCIKIFAKYISKKKTKVNYLERLCDLEKSILTKWNNAVLEDIQNHPYTQEEKQKLTEKEQIELEDNTYIPYGTTMIFAFVCNGYLFISQLGDGDCRILIGNDLICPFANDPALQFGRTTSLCGRNAIEQIRHSIIHIDKMKACFISTDGVKNSFDTENSFQNFIKKLIGIERTEGYRKAQNDLKGFLPQLSKQGSGDDLSIGLLL